MKNKQSRGKKYPFGWKIEILDNMDRENDFLRSEESSDSLGKCIRGNIATKPQDARWAETV